MACWVGCRRRGLGTRREEVEGEGEGEGLGGYVCTDGLFHVIYVGGLMDEESFAGIDAFPAGVGELASCVH